MLLINSNVHRQIRHSSEEYVRSHSSVVSELKERGYIVESVTGYFDYSRPVQIVTGGMLIDKSDCLHPLLYGTYI